MAEIRALSIRPAGPMIAGSPDMAQTVSRSDRPRLPAQPQVTFVGLSAQLVMVFSTDREDQHPAPLLSLPPSPLVDPSPDHSFPEATILPVNC